MQKISYTNEGQLDRIKGFCEKIVMEKHKTIHNANHREPKCDSRRGNEEEEKQRNSMEIAANLLL